MKLISLVLLVSSVSQAQFINRFSMNPQPHNQAPVYQQAPEPVYVQPDYNGGSYIRQNGERTIHCVSDYNGGRICQ